MDPSGTQSTFHNRHLPDGGGDRFAAHCMGWRSRWRQPRLRCGAGSATLQHNRNSLVTPALTAPAILAALLTSGARRRHRSLLWPPGLRDGKAMIRRRQMTTDAQGLVS